MSGQNGYSEQSGSDFEPSLSMDFSAEDMDDIPSLDEDDDSPSTGMGDAAAGVAGRLAASGGFLDSLGGMTVSKMLLVAVVPVILLVVAGLYFMLSSPSEPKPVEETAKVDRPAAKMPLPSPYQTENMRVLLFSQIDEKRDFMELGLQLVFFGQEGVDYYRAHELTFRNAVYDYLTTKATPKSNSWGGWNDVVSVSLLGYLKEQFPKASVAKVILDEARRL